MSDELTMANLMDAMRLVREAYERDAAQFEADGLLAWCCDCGKYGKVTLEMVEDVVYATRELPGDRERWLECECGRMVEVYRLLPVAPMLYRHDASITLSRDAADA